MICFKSFLIFFPPRHPLFPLMELLFVKCEQASQTSDCPSSDSFDVDIQTFVQRQEKERKPFFSEDTELDNLVGESFQEFTHCANLF